VYDFANVIYVTYQQSAIEIVTCCCSQQQVSRLLWSPLCI